MSSSSISRREMEVTIKQSYVCETRFTIHVDASNNKNVSDEYKVACPQWFTIIFGNEGTTKSNKTNWCDISVTYS